MSIIDHHQRTISVARLAAVLDVPAPTIRGWIARGVLRSVRIGGRRLVPVEAVEELLSRTEPEAPRRDGRSGMSRRYQAAYRSASGDADAERARGAVVEVLRGIAAQGADEGDGEDPAASAGADCRGVSLSGEPAAGSGDVG